MAWIISCVKLGFGHKKTFRPDDVIGSSTTEWLSCKHWFRGFSKVSWPCETLGNEASYWFLVSIVSCKFLARLFGPLINFSMTFRERSARRANFNSQPDKILFIDLLSDASYHWALNGVWQVFYHTLNWLLRGFGLPWAGVWCCSDSANT